MYIRPSVYTLPLCGPGATLAYPHLIIYVDSLKRWGNRTGFLDPRSTFGSESSKIKWQSAVRGGKIHRTHQLLQRVCDVRVVERGMKGDMLGTVERV